MPVLFIVQRMESLSHTFVFAGLWLYVSGRREQLAGTVCWGKVLTSLILFPVLGLLSKESAVLLPLYSFCLELFVFGFRTGDPRREPRILWLYGLVLFLPALLGGYWMLSRALAPGSFGSRDFSLIERLLTEPRVVLDYLRWTLLPNIGQLGLYHDDYPISRGLLQPPQTLLAIATLLVMPALAWLLRRRRPLTAIGLCWFLAAQVLTATFLPLELVFEHRNYFASLGICLMLVDLLVIAPTSKTRRRISAAATIALLFFYGFTTHLRAIEWSDPLRFAQTEAAKHPLSPRATYQLGQTYVILSQAKPGTVMTQAAFAALEHARTVPRSGILPTQGLLLLSSRTGATMNEDWWQDIEGKLREQPIGPQELGAMAALTDCQIGGHCRFPNAKLEALYVAALSQGPHPEVFNLYGSFLLNLRGNTTIAERMWRESVRLSPTNLQYRINLTRLLVATGKYGEARTEIARLRKLSRLGATRMEADRLQRRLDAATAGSSPPSGRADDR